MPHRLCFMATGRWLNLAPGPDALYIVAHRSGFERRADARSQLQKSGLHKIVWGVPWANELNSKAALFFPAYLPQFIAPDAADNRVPQENTANGHWLVESSLPEGSHLAQPRSHTSGRLLLLNAGRHPEPVRAGAGFAQGQVARSGGCAVRRERRGLRTHELNGPAPVLLRHLGEAVDEGRPVVPVLFRRRPSEPFEHDLAARRAAFDLRVHPAQGCGVDPTGGFGGRRADATGIDQRRHLVQQLPLARRHATLTKRNPMPVGAD